eukprot:TRINITY_DN1598_c1_g2_i1.p1 TRINITY_DN1598_c1_g2~~TRINITY_DN1598_c1_g2_i1.p1  ORF type:complete len:294 (+),score=53.11 TRINITY_DN1598_c1_g2_i1:54-935(+)
MDEVKEALQHAAIEIAEVMRVGDLNSNFGKKKGTQNDSGDHQETVDVIADEAMEKWLMRCSAVRGFASEERDDVIMKAGNEGFLVTYDPLDGSQNIAVNITTGMIFAVFKEARGLPRNGRDIVAAGYAIFGAATSFVFATKAEGVCLYTLNHKTSRFERTKTDHKIPTKGKVYACNEGLVSSWCVPRSVAWAGAMRGRSVRWMACMASDAHRILMNGGGFLLPADAKNSNGKLRLVYEAYPMAFIFETAGGTGTLENLTPLLDMPFPHQVQKLHMKVPVFLAGPAESEVYSKL